MTANEYRTQVDAVVSEMVERVGGESSKYAGKVREEMSGCYSTITRFEQGIVGKSFVESKIQETTQFTNRTIDRIAKG